VKRELEDGWFQHVEMPLPALLTIQSGISKLRYATLMGIKKAKSKEVRRVTAASLGVAPARPASCWSESICRSAPSTRSFSRADPRSGGQLVEKLKFEARVI
jgi:electron transfer flavoprotein beta subunit